MLYRNPNPHLDVAGDVKFGIRSRLRPVGGGHTGWRDKIDYAKFIVKAITLARREKPDVVIGYDTLGIVAAFIVTRIRPLQCDLSGSELLCVAVKGNAHAAAADSDPDDGTAGFSASGMSTYQRGMGSLP
ncbi:MAG: hypothetical protein O3B43_06255 [Chloroflexi bacterium]|nr:hypothetical protein [Chloroflexota bacterium]